MMKRALAVSSTAPTFDMSLLSVRYRYTFR